MAKFNVVSVRVSDDDLKLFKICAKQDGTSVSECIRGMIAKGLMLTDITDTIAAAKRVLDGNDKGTVMLVESIFEMRNNMRFLMQERDQKMMEMHRKLAQKQAEEALGMKD
jgi:fructosamine-3-kinase